MTDDGRCELKAVFSLLVERCGGVVPCGARLSISHQRISQLQALDHKDAPNLLLHILPLEGWCKEPVVTGHYARKIMGGRTGQPLDEAMQAIEASVAMGKAIRTDEDTRTQLTAALEAKRQLDDVIMSLQRSQTD